MDSALKLRLPKLHTGHRRAASTMPTPELDSLQAALASKADTQTAAHNFTDPARKMFAVGAAESAIESCLTRGWNSIIDLAADTHHESQGSLVDTILAVQKQNIAEQEDASECTIWGEKKKVWKDMPLFGPTMREAWNKAPGTGSPSDFDDEQWCNLNALAARLTSVSQLTPALDFSLYGIWTLRSALEGTDKASSANEKAAKVWFIYAKETIERLSREEKTFDGKLAKAGEKYNGKEWRGFNSERLELWQAALQ